MLESLLALCPAETKHAFCLTVWPTSHGCRTFRISHYWWQLKIFLVASTRRVGTSHTMSKKSQQHFVHNLPTSNTSMQFLAKKLHESNTINTYKHLLHLDSAVTLPSKFFLYIQFRYLRCCGCPGLRGRQHLALTCHNTEAGFLTGWLLCLSPNPSETPPFPPLGCVPAVVPTKGGSSA